MRWQAFATLGGSALVVLGACMPGGIDAASRVGPTTATTSRVTVGVGRAASARPSVPTTSVLRSVAAGSESAVDRVRADFTTTWEALIDCVTTPERCDLAGIAAPDSPVEALTRARVDELLREHLRALPGSGPVRLTIESVAIEDATASVQTCITDGLVVVDPQDPATPLDDIVFDDAVNSYRSRWTMSRTTAGWRRHDVERLGFFPGMLACGAR